MGISLYPKGLIKEIDNFLVSYDEFYEKLLKIKDIGKRHFNKKFNQDLWYHLLGIEHLKEATLKKYTDRPIFKLHVDKAEEVKREQANLIGEISNLLEERERMRMKIFGRLEDFLQSNSLRLKEESHYPYLSYP